MSKTIICKHITVAFVALSLSVIGCVKLLAQSAVKIEKKADESFKNKNYYNAAILYSTILYQTPIGESSESLVYPVQAYTKSSIHKINESSRNRITYKLAESYRLYNHFKDAAVQYQQYLSSKDTQFPLAELWYGYCLLANNDPKQAESTFNIFLKKYHTKDGYAEIAREGIASCKLILSYQTEKPVATIAKIQSTTSEDGSNFALEKMNDNEFWFSSSRQELNKNHQKVYPLRLYTGNFKNNSVNKVFDQVANDVNMAANTFGNDGNLVFFTGWKEDKKSGVPSFAIYYMNRTDANAKWSNPVMLPSPVNIKGYQSKQPALTADGKYLLFSSDRPNGFGKFDLWMVAMNAETPIGNALNLGATINTAGNEVTPFYNSTTSQLSFSSDGRLGMGGLDIYETTGLISQNQWNDSIIHLGIPYNSVRDDQYFKSYGNSDTGYLSSDRFSSCCLEIFQTTKIKNIDSIKASIVKLDTLLNKVIDKDKKIENAVKVEYEDKKNDKELSNTIALAEENKENHLLDSINSITFIRRNVYYNFASSKVRKEDNTQLNEIVSVLEKNPELNILIASFTDCKGSQEANIRLSRKRSESVRWYLMSKGISTSRINIDFFGKEHFVMQCKEDTTYHKGPQLANRRSDLIITKVQKPKWIPSGRELDISKIKVDSNYHSREFYAITRRLKLENYDKVENIETVKNEKKIEPSKYNKVEIKSSKSNSIDPKKINNYFVRNKEVHSIPLDKNKTIIEKLPGTTWNYTEKKYMAPLPDKLPIMQLLDMTPRLKESEVIEEMTKRVPRKPIEVYSTSDSVRVDLYDNGVFDYDTVSVIFDKHIAVYKELLQVDKPISFYVKLNGDQSRNEMIFFAENLGLTPPNSALMVITDADNKRTEVSVASDLNHNVVIYFIKLNKGQLKKD